MRKIVYVLFALILTQSLQAHHGPGIRGYDPNKPVAIKGVILKCFECSNGSRGHGWLQVQVDSVIWGVTLPDTPGLRKAKVSLSKLKKGTAIEVSGFANVSKPHDMYANEVVVNGLTLFSPAA